MEVGLPPECEQLLGQLTTVEGDFLTHSLVAEDEFYCRLEKNGYSLHCSILLGIEDDGSHWGCTTLFRGKETIRSFDGKLPQLREMVDHLAGQMI
jgi:hypothetical protein